MSLKKIYKKMPALLKRTAWAKTLGLIVSAIAFLAIIASGQYPFNPHFSWGVLLWYPLVGAMVGLAGVMDKHPLLGKMGIWRGIMIAAFMNLVLALIAHESFSSLISNMGYDISTSMLLIGALLEGAIIGGAIDWYVTAKFGEGKKLLKK